MDNIESLQKRVAELECLNAQLQARVTDFELGIAHRCTVSVTAEEQGRQSRIHAIYNPLGLSWTGAERD